MYDTYDYTVPTTTTVDEGAAAVMIAFLATFWIVFLALTVFLLVCLWKIFVKAGKPGWAALVPIYNTYVLMEIIGKPWWWLFGFLLAGIPGVGPYLGMAFTVVVSLELARKFGQSTVFGIFGLWIFSFVGFPILAFGKAKYNKSAAPVVTFLSGDGSKPTDTPAV